MVAVLGLPDGALGVVWPSIRHTFGRPVGDLGILALAGLIPYLLTSTSVTRVVSRIGFGAMSVVFAVLAAAAMSVWASAPAWALVVAAVAVFGLSKGAVDSGFNAYISEHEGVRRLGLLHAGYGIGATIAPLLVASILSIGAGWRVAIATLAAANVVVAVLTFGARHGWRTSAHSAGREDLATPARTGRTAGVTMILVTFVVYTATEAGTGAWAFVVGTDGRHLDRGLCAAAVATYWAMLTGGRLLLAGIGGRVRRETVLIVGSALAVGGIGLFWLDRSATGLIGLGAAGFGFAATFPVAISLVPDYVGDRRAAQVIGWCVAFAAVGGPAGTAVAGLLAGSAGLAAVPVLFFGLAVGLLACVTRLSAIRPAPN
jgi:fucose permease